MQGTDTSAVSARARDLDAREQALKKREKELAEREAAVARGETGGKVSHWYKQVWSYRYMLAISGGGEAAVHCIQSYKQLAAAIRMQSI